MSARKTRNSSRITPGGGHLVKAHRAMPRNLCFACGPDNPHGLRLKFQLAPDGRSFLCRFRLSSRYTGPPGHSHGGIIATILDEAMGKALKLRKVVALTREMTVEFLRPVPLGKPLTVEGWSRSAHGRVHINVAEIRNAQGQVLARSRGRFIAIDPEKMFAKYMKGSSQGARWRRMKAELEKD